MTMTRPWPAPQSPARARNWLVVALGLLTTVLAAAALIVALTRSGAASSPTYTAEQKAEAKTQLCERYKLAGQAMHIETSSDDVALARVALSNGALMLERSAANPALDAKYRDAARALADSYQTQAAMGTTGMATREQYLAAVDDTNAKDRAMQGLCSHWAVTGFGMFTPFVGGPGIPHDGENVVLNRTRTQLRLAAM